MAEGGGLKQIEDVLYAPRHLEFVIIPDWKFQIEFSSIGFVLNTNGGTVVAKRGACGQNTHQHNQKPLHWKMDQFCDWMPGYVQFGLNLRAASHSLIMTSIATNKSHVTSSQLELKLPLLSRQYELLPLQVNYKVNMDFSQNMAN